MGKPAARNALLAAFGSTLACAAFLLLAAPAFAYHTDSRETSGFAPAAGWTCIDCHGDDRDAWTGEGPHGYYTTTTKKCRECHAVHRAPASSILLLPAATIRQTCFTCHDNTGAVGVYSSITARGGSVAASHAVEITSVVPGGSVPLSAALNCDSCHTPHRATSLAPFLRDTGKAMSSTEYIWSNCLLRDDVGGHARGTYTTYGGGWCAGCHDQRMSGGVMHNHPTSQTPVYSLGRPENVPFPPSPSGIAQAGYVMTDAPRPAPYCQQCHEDARDVEATFSASFKDYGYPSPDAPTNPAFVTFPHQTANRYFTVEAYDDLCLNCHDATELP